MVSSGGQLPSVARGGLFHQHFGANAVGTGRHDAHVDHIADLEPRRDDMDRLEPGRLADQLAFEIALAFEQPARRSDEGSLVERLLLFVSQGMKPLEPHVYFSFLNMCAL